MIHIEKYIEDEKFTFIKYSFFLPTGEKAFGEFARKTKRKAMLMYADVVRTYILIILEESGIKTTGMHNMEICSFLSSIYAIENSIKRQVKRSFDVFQASRILRGIINKLNTIA